MKTQRLSLLVVAALLVAAMLGGCQTPVVTKPSTPIGPVGVGGFVEEWRAPLPLGAKEPLTRLYLRDEMLFAYTGGNAIYAISATGGQVLWIHHIGQAGDQILPPLVMEKNVTVIPGISTIERVDDKGRVLKPIEIGHSVRSALTGSGNFVYAGLDYPRGGRLAKIDLTKPFNNTVWEFTTSAGISAAPVLFQNVIFAGGEDGRVYAVNEARDIVWPLPDGVFKTDGRILADLKAESSGLYVASTDTKLYCLDIATGRIKWQYYSSVPLVDSPAITADTVYQSLPNVGVVALDKTSTDYNRKPRWTVQYATRFLADDEQYAYLQNGDNSIVGVDKKTGEPKFHSQRTDLVAFASNPKTGLVYAATSDGMVLAIKPVTKAGSVGQVVMNHSDADVVALAK